MPGGKKQKGKGKPSEKVTLVAEEEMLETNSESSEESLAKTNAAKKGKPPQASGAAKCASTEADLERDEKIPPSRPKKPERATAREQKQKKHPITGYQREALQIEPSSESVEDDESEEPEEEMECAPYVTTRARGGGMQSKKMKLKDKDELEEEGTKDKKEPTVQAASKRAGSRKKQQDSAGPLGRGVKQTRQAVSTKGKKSAVSGDEATIAGKEEQGEATGGHSSPRQYWLMKSEPEPRLKKGVDVSFGLQDLIDEEEQIASWDGVRNAQARNIMRDQMKVGDIAFFYHSNCKEPGIAGLVEIVREGYIDPTQFDENDPHYDPKSSRDDPKWFMVDVKFVRAMKKFIPLSELKRHSRAGGSLSKMALFNNSRLSVQPVTPEEFQFIVEMEEGDQPGPL